LDAYFPNVSWSCLLAGKGIYPNQEQLKRGNALAHQYDVADIQRYIRGCALNFKSHKEQLDALAEV